METTTETNKQAWAAASAASASAETERKQSAKPPRTLTEKHGCTLTPAELLDRGKQLADALAESARLDAERKNVNDEYKAKIELAESRARELAAVVRSKTEQREIEVIEEFIFATNTVRYVRADTQEVLRERAMTNAERQEELPLPKSEKKGEQVDAKAEQKNGTAKGDAKTAAAPAPAGGEEKGTKKKGPAT